MNINPTSYHTAPMSVASKKTLIRFGSAGTHVHGPNCNHGHDHNSKTEENKKTTFRFIFTDPLKVLWTGITEFFKSLRTDIKSLFSGKKTETPAPHVHGPNCNHGHDHDSEAPAPKQEKPTEPHAHGPNCGCPTHAPGIIGGGGPKAAPDLSAGNFTVKS